MLFRKTFRNALATLLGMALALATGAAHAQINLDAAGTEADPVGTITVAAETLSSQGNDAGRTAGYFDVHLDSAQLRVSGQVGVRGTETRPLFILWELTNLVFQRNTAESMSIPDRDTRATATGNQALALVKEHGGNANDNYVVYSATPPAGGEVSATAVAVATLHNELAMRSNMPGSITQRVYLEYSDALSRNDNFVASTSKTKVVLQPTESSLTTDVVGMGGSVTATVASGFTALSGSMLGQLSIALLTPAPANAEAGQDIPAAGQPITAIDDVAKLGAGGSVMTFTGNFAVGNFSATAGAECGGTALATTNADGELLETVAMSNSVSTPLVATSLGMTTFCVTAPTGNDDPFPESAYEVAVTYAALDNAAAKPTDLTAKRIGEIVRDSSRANIPYLTTYSGYNQRVIIVNRNDADITYKFTFTTEDGVMAEDGDAAEGTAPGNSTTVLRAADIVTLTEGNRTAATLEVSATEGAVDVATTQVNQQDGSTDTVLYEVVTGT